MQIMSNITRRGNWSMATCPAARPRDVAKDDRIPHQDHFQLQSGDTSRQLNGSELASGGACIGHPPTDCNQGVRQACTPELLMGHEVRERDCVVGASDDGATEFTAATIADRSGHPNSFQTTTKNDTLQKVPEKRASANSDTVARNPQTIRISRFQFNPTIQARRATRRERHLAVSSRHLEFVRLLAIPFMIEWNGVNAKWLCGLQSARFVASTDCKHQFQC